MADFTEMPGEGGDTLVDESNVALTDDLPDEPPPSSGTVFPISLMLRLRLHAAWLLFMLMPT